MIVLLPVFRRKEIQGSETLAQPAGQAVVIHKVLYLVFMGESYDATLRQEMGFLREVRKGPQVPLRL